VSEITPLIKRSFLVISSLAFEIIDDPTFGAKYVRVTDCEDETFRAQYVDIGGSLMQKVSSFGDVGKQVLLEEVVKLNTKFILEELYG